MPNTYACKLVFPIFPRRVCTLVLFIQLGNDCGLGINNSPAIGYNICMSCILLSCILHKIYTYGQNTFWQSIVAMSILCSRAYS